MGLRKVSMASQMVVGLSGLLIRAPIHLPILHDVSIFILHDVPILLSDALPRILLVRESP